MLILKNQQQPPPGLHVFGVLLIGVAIVLFFESSSGTMQYPFAKQSVCVLFNINFPLP